MQMRVAVFPLALFGVLMLIGRLPIQRPFVCSDCRIENLPKCGAHVAVASACRERAGRGTKRPPGHLPLNESDISRRQQKERIRGNAES